MLLGIDTATRFISLALHDGDRIVAESTWETANNHTIELAPAVRAMLGRAGMDTPPLSAVAVALGPGSFTGLRIGLGFAKGLATTLAIPLLGIPTLAALAAGQPRFDGRLIAVLQAGRGRLCAQRFAWGADGWTPEDEAAIVSWEALLGSLGDGRPSLISGEIDADGRRLLTSYGAGFGVSVAPAALRMRRAGYLADLAWARFQRGDVDDPLTLVPIYLHQPGVPHP